MICHYVKQVNTWIVSKYEVILEVLILFWMGLEVLSIDIVSYKR
jgi:hypothetical protein